MVEGRCVTERSETEASTPGPIETYTHQLKLVGIPVLFALRPNSADLCRLQPAQQPKASPSDRPWRPTAATESELNRLTASHIQLKIANQSFK